MSRYRIRKYNTGGVYPGQGPNAGMTTDMFAHKDPWADVGSGALQGASTGMAFGPWGAAAGAVIGGAQGLIQNKLGNAQLDQAKEAHLLDQSRSQIQQQQALANDSVQQKKFAGYRDGGRFKLRFNRTITK